MCANEISPQTSAPWRVLKFGGTSVATLERWQAIQGIARRTLSEGERPFLVCSALSGVTDLLAELIRGGQEPRAVASQVDGIVERHVSMAGEMGLDGEAILKDAFALLRGLPERHGELGASPALSAQILSLGEMMSTRLGAAWLNQAGTSTAWIDARALLKARPDPTLSSSDGYLSASCDDSFSPEARQAVDGVLQPVLITQGFVAANAAGETVVLGRGGSDTSAAYVAALIGAQGLEIWTDVPGTFSANPRAVAQARLLRRLSFDEVFTMTGLGAKLLHPRSLGPVRRHGIPLNVRWTRFPTFEHGTRVEETGGPPGVKSVGRRDGLLLMRMERSTSWQPVGFMAAVSSAFAQAGLSMDLVSSCPSSIVATLDPQACPGVEGELDALRDTLAEVCEVSMRRGVSSISLVGTQVSRHLEGASALFADLPEGAVHFISHSANDHHLTYVVDRGVAAGLEVGLHRVIFGAGLCQETFGPDWASIEASTQGTPESTSTPRAAEPVAGAQQEASL